MSEEIRKPGRPPMNKENRPPNPKFYDEAPKPDHQEVVETKQPARDGRYSGKCRRFIVHKVPNCSDWAFAGPGTLTPIHIQRGKEVVLPEEYFEAFKSAGRDVLMCDMSDPHRDPEYYTEFKTDYPYQDMGEATWEEYMEFRTQNAKKDHPNKAKKR